jgi:hypothetical protein
MLCKGRVELQDAPADWGIDIGDGLDRLKRGNDLPGVDLLPSRNGEVHVHDVSEFVLGVVGDANGSGAVVHSEPFVVLGVVELFGEVHGELHGWLDLNGVLAPIMLLQVAR